MGDDVGGEGNSCSGDVYSMVRQSNIKLRDGHQQLYICSIKCITHNFQLKAHTCYHTTRTLLSASLPSLFEPSLPSLDSFSFSSELFDSFDSIERRGEKKRGEGNEKREGKGRGEKRGERRRERNRENG
jgi:hypothetical protein